MGIESLGKERVGSSSPFGSFFANLQLPSPRVDPAASTWRSCRLFPLALFAVQGIATSSQLTPALCYLLVCLSR